MSISINVNITLDEGQQYTALEAGVIAALSGNAPAAAAATAAPAAPAAKVEAPAPAAKPVTRRAAAAAKAAAKVAEAEPVEEDTEDEGPAAALEDEDDADEDLLGAAPAKAKAPTLEDAVAAATELVSNGEQARVKEALSGLGAKRVSELKGAKIGQFLTALED